MAPAWLERSNNNEDRGTSELEEQRETYLRSDDRFAGFDEYSNAFTVFYRTVYQKLLRSMFIRL